MGRKKRQDRQARTLGTADNQAKKSGPQAARFQRFLWHFLCHRSCKRPHRPLPKLSLRRFPCRGQRHCFTRYATCFPLHPTMHPAASIPASPCPVHSIFTLCVQLKGAENDKGEPSGSPFLHHCLLNNQLRHLTAALIRHKIRFLSPFVRYFLHQLKRFLTFFAGNILAYCPLMALRPG